MALKSLTQIAQNLNNAERAMPDIYEALVELQGLSFFTAAGAGANTNIAVTNIATTDTLIAVFEFTVTAGNFTAIVDRTSVASITSAGNIQLTTSTSGDQLLIIWANKS